MRILFKGNNWLGDAIMSLPAIKSSKEKMPNSYVAVLTLSGLADLYKATGFVDEIIQYDKSIVSVAKNIKEKKFDSAIIFPRSFSSAYALYSTGVPRRIGYKGDARDFLLTDAVSRNGILKRHRVEYYMNLLKPLVEDINPSAPAITIPNAAKELASEKLMALGIVNDIVVGINPGANYGNAKCWHPERFAEVAKGLIKIYNAKVLVLGSSKENTIAESIVNAVGHGIYNLVGKTNLLELIAIIEKCKLFLTNDTGPMHIADALGVPIVAIFGPTDPVATSPFGNKNTIIYHKVECSPCLLRTCPINHRCMKLVAADEVLKACEGWLNK